jgi:hypothetical protein
VQNICVCSTTSEPFALNGTCYAQCPTGYYADYLNQKCVLCLQLSSSNGYCGSACATGLLQLAQNNSILCTCPSPSTQVFSTITQSCVNASTVGCNVGYYFTATTSICLRCLDSSADFAVAQSLYATANGLQLQEVTSYILSSAGIDYTGFAGGCSYCTQ